MQPYCLPKSKYFVTEEEMFGEPAYLVRRKDDCHTVGYRHDFQGAVRYAKKRDRADNPELLIVNNPGRRRSMRRRRRTRRRNSPLTVTYRGRRTSYRALVKRHGVKVAARMWRKAKRKRHGYGRSAARCTTRRRRKRNPRRRKTFGRRRRPARRRAKSVRRRRTRASNRRGRRVRRTRRGRFRRR